MSDNTITDLLDISQSDVIFKSRTPSNLRNFQQKAFQDRLDVFEKLLNSINSSEQIELIIANQNSLDLEQEKVLGTLNQLLAANNKTLNLLESINNTLLDAVSNADSRKDEILKEINNIVSDKLDILSSKLDGLSVKATSFTTKPTSTSTSRNSNRNTAASRSTTRPTSNKDEFVRGDEIYEE